MLCPSGEAQETSWQARTLALPPSCCSQPVRPFRIITTENPEQNQWELEKWLKKSQGPVAGSQLCNMCETWQETGTCRLSLLHQSPQPASPSVSLPP